MGRMKDRVSSANGPLHQSQFLRCTLAHHCSSSQEEANNALCCRWSNRCFPFFHVSLTLPHQWKRSSHCRNLEKVPKLTACQTLKGKAGFWRSENAQRMCSYCGICLKGRESLPSCHPYSGCL